MIRWPSFLSLLSKFIFNYQKDSYVLGLCTCGLLYCSGCFSVRFEPLVVGFPSRLYSTSGSAYQYGWCLIFHVCVGVEDCRSVRAVEMRYSFSINLTIYSRTLITPFLFCFFFFFFLQFLFFSSSSMYFFFRGYFRRRR